MLELIKLYQEDPLREQKEPGPVTVEGQEEYEVERIVRSRRMKGQRVLYEIKWKDYPEDENTWEPIENLVNAREHLDYFFKKHPRVKGVEEWRLLGTSN